MNESIINYDCFVKALQFERGSKLMLELLMLEFCIRVPWRDAQGERCSLLHQVVTEGGKVAGGKLFKKPSGKISEARGKETVGRNESQDHEGNQQEISKEKEKGGGSRKMTAQELWEFANPN